MCGSMPFLSRPRLNSLQGHVTGHRDEQSEDVPPHVARSWAAENHESYGFGEPDLLNDEAAFWTVKLTAEDVLKLPFSSRAMVAAIHQYGPEVFQRQMQVGRLVPVILD